MCVGAIFTEDLGNMEDFAKAILDAVAIARRSRVPLVGVPDPDQVAVYEAVLKDPK
jgi:hypothetical protein